jgi:hypothetical protein
MDKFGMPFWPIDVDPDFKKLERFCTTEKITFCSVTKSYK